ncbi:siderophore iron transporter [Pseudomassariella vexata]|uniref:Siderophore iron transporter n=1 Tax=Pseudomassariella vexata TaxID=1141098 RepID=A0A1Y2DYX0_9PEZI|nr:siderophore iron transporter [Pseudomassariella vexata]ORY64508.1 siderophore iron transporter [Pseudomassariella vexata]
MRASFAWKTPLEAPVGEKTNHPAEPDKEAGVISSDPHNKSQDGQSDTDIDAIDTTAQRGVQKIEATTKYWSQSNLVLAYIFIWIITFVDAMQQGTTGLLTPYVTSGFSQHSLTAAAGVFSSLIGGVTKLPLAKLIDIWGRPHGYILMVVILTVGLVMMAACQNVETYAAAQVFYWVGYNGLSYIMGIFVADTSSLRNRSFMFAFQSSPYIITVWITGPFFNAIVKPGGMGFRWGFGIFAIIMPVVCLPLWVLFMYNQRQAVKSGMLPKKSSGRTTWESIKYYFIQFDAVGVLCLCAGFSLFLLPFNIYSYQYYGWKDKMTIGPLVGGFVLLCLFVVWETWYSPVNYMPWELLKDRTVLGANVLACVLFISFYIWDSYFSSFLQIVPNLSPTYTAYVVNIYSIGSCFWSLLIGVYIHYRGRFKNLALYFGIPLTILGVGLMIAFRQPHVNVGYIVMCQIFIAFAGGTLVICEQMAVMAATSHQYVAVVLAMEGMFSSIGGAIGQSVAGATWTSVFPAALAKYLPEEEQGNLTTIYGDLTVQLSYPVGSATRDAINAAYGDAQKWMLVGGTAILVLAIPAVMVWRNINVIEFKQVKGRVF